MVKKYDHIVSDDLYHWLDYVSMKEEEFWKIADTFRQKNVWKKSKGKWIKKIFGMKSKFKPIKETKIRSSKFKNKLVKAYKKDINFLLKIKNFL